MTSTKPKLKEASALLYSVMPELTRYHIYLIFAFGGQDACSFSGHILSDRVAGATAVPFNGCHLPINISMSSPLGAPGSTVDKVSQEKKNRGVFLGCRRVFGNGCEIQNPWDPCMAYILTLGVYLW